MAKPKKEIVQILATKYNLPLSEIEAIIEYQFSYVADVMKEGKFESIRLPKVGRFSVKPGRLKYIQKKVNGSTDDKR
jgi:nucleoid DNA-binding protein